MYACGRQTNARECEPSFESVQKEREREKKRERGRKREGEREPHRRGRRGDGHSGDGAAAGDGLCVRGGLSAREGVLRDGHVDTPVACSCWRAQGSRLSAPKIQKLAERRLCLAVVDDYSQREALSHTHAERERAGTGKGGRG